MSRNRRAPRRRSITPPPAHVVAFMDQVDAAGRAGDLPDGVAVHFDVITVAGVPVDFRPRVCTAAVDVDCSGTCS